MSKKLLALLVAVSTCCAFGCSDDDSDSCKTGEKRCDGNNAQICVNGNWSKGTPCADGCDKATGVCTVPPATCKTAGEKRCSGKELQECKDGNWSKVEVCTGSCDEAKKECVPVEPPSDKCTATSTSKCTGTCSTDKKAGYFWSKDTLKTVDCPNADCTDTNGYVQCGEPPACTATSTERCNVACSADKSVGYYWNGKENKVGERKCPNKDCTIEGTSVKCGDGDPKCTGEKVPTGGEEGACCDAATYQVSCINENANALICAKGAVKKWTCKDNICSVGSDNKVKCDNPNGTGGSQTTTCTGEKVQTGGEEGACCDAATYQVSCINDNANALICAKGAVKKWTCKDNICSVGSDNKVKCDNPNGTGGGTGTGEACDKATTNPVCNEAGDKVTYCSSSNELKEKDCPQCYVNGGVFWCNGDQNLTNCVKGGTSKCKGNCVSDTLGYIWNKDENMVKEYTCTAPKKCTDNGAGYLSCK